jgi:hypothetical protein
MIGNTNPGRRALRAACLAPALLGLLLFAGCDGKGKVSGKVTYKGQVLNGGNVRFMNDTHNSFTVSIAEDGSYVLDKLPPGNYRIGVDNQLQMMPAFMAQKMMSQKGAKKSAEAQQEIGEMKEKLGAKEGVIKLPLKAADPLKSGMTCTVKPGSQTFDIEVQD